jgi:hypothetical protein
MRKRAAAAINSCTYGCAIINDTRSSADLYCARCSGRMRLARRADGDSRNDGEMESTELTSPSDEPKGAIYRELT